jgi:hypothetical protein
MDWLSDPTAWTALAALLTLEIVLGVDNVIFISILASKLPAELQDKARRIGLLALQARLHLPERVTGGRRDRDQGRHRRLSRRVHDERPRTTDGGSGSLTQNQ